MTDDQLNKKFKDLSKEIADVEREASDKGHLLIITMLILIIILWDIADKLK